jgi:hypothetical protein
LPPEAVCALADARPAVESADEALARCGSVLAGSVELQAGDPFWQAVPLDDYSPEALPDALVPLSAGSSRDVGSAARRAADCLVEALQGALALPPDDSLPDERLVVPEQADWPVVRAPADRAAPHSQLEPVDVPWLAWPFSREAQLLRRDVQPPPDAVAALRFLPTAVQDVPRALAVVWQKAPAAGAGFSWRPPSAPQWPQAARSRVPPSQLSIRAHCRVLEPQQLSRSWEPMRSAAR